MTAPIALTLWSLACGPSEPAYFVPGRVWSYESTLSRSADEALLQRWNARRLAWSETEYHHRGRKAISKSGARGLTQILAADQDYLVRQYLAPGAKYRWDRAQDSALLGCMYLADLIRRTGSIRRGVQAYHQGPNSVLRGEPPGPRTRAYLVRFFGGGR